MSVPTQHDSIDRQPNSFIDLDAYNPGSHGAAHNSEVGQKCFAICVSRIGSHLLLGAVLAAPTRPPQPAVEPLLIDEVGEAAFTDPMKRYIGAVVRFVIEQLGGEHHSYGSNVRVRSYFSKGSTYRLKDWHPLND